MAETNTPPEDKKEQEPDAKSKKQTARGAKKASRLVRFSSSWRKLSFYQRFVNYLTITSMVMAVVSAIIAGLALIQNDYLAEREEQRAHQEQTRVAEDGFEAATRYAEQQVLQTAQQTLDANIATSSAEFNAAQESLRATQIALHQMDLQLQTTVQAQTDSQIYVQETQVAIAQEQLDIAGQMRLLYEFLALPNMEIVQEEFAIESAYIITQTSLHMTIGVQGTANLVLANNGGGRAGLLGVSWEDINFQAITTEVELPWNFEGQGAYMLGLEFHGTGLVSQSEKDALGLVWVGTEYQLARLWANTVIMNSPKLVLSFSNANSITVPISGFALDSFPVTTLEFLGPFITTDADIIGEVVFENALLYESVTLIRNNEESVQLTLPENGIFYLPQDKYTVIVNDYIVGEFDFGFDRSVLVPLPVPTPTYFPQPTLLTTPFPSATPTRPILSACDEDPNLCEINTPRTYRSYLIGAIIVLLIGTLFFLAYTSINKKKVSVIGGTRGDYYICDWPNGEPIVPLEDYETLRLLKPVPILDGYGSHYWVKVRNGLGVEGWVRTDCLDKY